jgi:two-component system cell cycle response regulator
MADLAGFKRVNDTLGHQEGDRVLTGVAEVIRSQLRESDWAVRYGGDEFLLTLPETGPDIETLLKRLERAVDSWCRENVVDVPVGIDFGWATWRPDDPQPIASVVREADDRLYEAKRSRTTARGV